MGTIMFIIKVVKRKRASSRSKNPAPFPSPAKTPRLPPSTSSLIPKAAPVQQHTLSWHRTRKTFLLRAQVGHGHRKHPPNPIMLLRTPAGNVDGEQHEPVKGATSGRGRRQMLPSFLRPLTTSIGLEDISFLQNELAFAIRDKGCQSEPMGLLLYQCVLFAGSSFVDTASLQVAGYKTRESAKKSLFTKVRALCDLNCERSHIIRVQALLIMSFCYETLDDEKDAYYWVGLAVALAYGAVLDTWPHRGYAEGGPGIPPLRLDEINLDQIESCDMRLQRWRRGQWGNRHPEPAPSGLCVASLVSELQAIHSGKYLPTNGIAAFTPALILHLLDADGTNEHRHPRTAVPHNIPDICSHPGSIWGFFDTALVHIVNKIYSSLAFSGSTNTGHARTPSSSDCQPPPMPSFPDVEDFGCVGASGSDLDLVGADPSGTSTDLLTTELMMDCWPNRPNCRAGRYAVRQGSMQPHKPHYLRTSVES
ncbi:putative fungal specific transcription factor [Zalerion maritima]|uniref:Fungal specific transcription factor n=1 Tax=Zalerion maritima TaxID=339359 RepID=A0AAD5RN37_9PEZI|nr:putative fungal specific transcription factor [Zalerion maritima]